ncbi:hypothetical protein [Spiroplasma endosymbiont of Cantharis lateralis]|uniref:hypothetical protein n=1 Tax=Spiroplasma endosymbiont of Cantharis lateralis TaxID=3066277 RepID=UPI00313C89D1
MKGLLLNTMKQEQLRLIKQLSLRKDSIKNTAFKLGYSVRHTRRKLKEYQEIGAKAFIHKNTNKIPINKISQLFKDEIIELFQTKYYDFSIKHYWELTWKKKISYSAIRHILIEENILIETLNRKTKKDIRKNLKAGNQENLTSEYLSKSIITSKPHPTQKKIVKFGEIFETDASNHQWIKNLKCHLHIVIDKASKRILAGYFSEQETTESYYNIYKKAFKHYGLPKLNVSDNRNVFSSKNNRDHFGDSVSNTQLQFIFHSLGVNTKTTSIPQEKALVERTFGTLQRRWPQIIRLLDLKNIDQLNDYLPYLIQEYNQDFSIPLDQLESITRKFDQDEDIVFSYRSERIIDNGHSISFKKDKWFICKGYTPIYFKPKLKVMIMETINKKHYALIGNDIYNLIQVEDERLHGNIKTLSNEEFKTTKVPKIDSPWKATNWYFFDRKRKNTRSIY